MRHTRSARRPPIGPIRLGVDVLLLCLVVVGLGGVVLGRVLPAVGHPVFVVAGPSMGPALPVGAAVVLESVTAEALRVGDVVSLRSGPSRAVFTHRITRVVERADGLWLETKGDANAEPDPSITPATAVIGRAAIALPLAGYGLTVLSQPPGVVLTLSSGALLIVLGWWLDDLAHARRRRAAAPSSTVVAGSSGSVPGAAPAIPAARAPRPPTRPQPRPRRTAQSRPARSRA